MNYTSSDGLFMSSIGKFQWGDDPHKWLIKKSSSRLGWCLFPPGYNDMIWVTTFDDARETFKALVRN